MATQITNRRTLTPAAAPPPPEPEEAEQSLFDYIISCITTVDPNFSVQQQHEDDNHYLTRICAFLSIPEEGDTSIHMPEETWQAMVDDAPDAQAWYEAAADAISNGQSVPAPEGFYQDPAPEPEPAPAPVQMMPARRAAPAPASAPIPAAQESKRSRGDGGAGLARWREEQRQAKAQSNGSQPAQRAAMPTRGPAPQAAPQVQMPARRSIAQIAQAPAQAPAPAPMPSRRLAAQAPVVQQPPPQKTRAPRATPEANDDLMIQSVVYYPNLTSDQLVEYAKSQNYPQEKTTVSAILSRVRTHMALFEKLGIIDKRALAKLQAQPAG